MTATIRPRTGVITAIADAEQRLSEYKDALSFNLKFIGQCVDEIIFAENSGSDLEELRQIAAGFPVRFIANPQENHPPSFGYGYSEMKLLQSVMDREEYSSDNFYVKVTGRYKILNLCKLISRIEKTHLFYDIRNYTRNPWLDLRIMGWNQSDFNQVLRNSYKLLRDDLNNRPPEMVLAKHLMSTSGVRQFAFEPNVQGRRGYDGKDWGTGLNYLKYLGRSYLRSLNLLR